MYYIWRQSVATLRNVFSHKDYDREKRKHAVSEGKD